MKHGMTSESLSTSLGARDDHPLPWTRDGCLTAGGRNQRHKKSPPAIGEHRRRKTRTFLVNHVGSTYETITDMWQLGLSSSGDGTLCFSTVCVDGRSWSEGAVRSELRDNPLATVWTVKDADWPGSTLPLSTPSQTLRLYILPRLAPCSIYSHYFPMPIFLIKLHCYVCQWSLSKLTLSHTTK